MKLDNWSTGNLSIETKARLDQLKKLAIAVHEVRECVALALTDPAEMDWMDEDIEDLTARLDALTWEPTDEPLAGNSKTKQTTKRIKT